MWLRLQPVLLDLLTTVWARHLTDRRDRECGLLTLETPISDCVSQRPQPCTGRMVCSCRSLLTPR